MTVNKTPFFDNHLALNAQMGIFADFQMPIYYTSIKQEHLGVRNAVGLFDVSHMGEFSLEGDGAADFLQYLTPNDINKIKTGKAQYSAMLNQEGNFIDDIIIYGLSVPHKYMLVVNASNIDKDKKWIMQHKPPQIQFADVSNQTCLLALQGPESIKLMQSLCEDDIERIPYYHFKEMTLRNGINLLLSATGYTGEKGFELYFHPNDASLLWNELLRLGKPYNLLPAGLGARDTLRIEKGYSLYGHEIDDTVNPFEASLGWIVNNKYDFIGKQSIQKKAIEKLKIGFMLEDKGISRAGQRILDKHNEVIGRVTSSTLSPSLNKVIGMGYVNKSYIEKHQSFFIESKTKLLKASIHKTPFIA